MSSLANPYRNLHIAGLGQLPAMQLAINDHLEPRPLKVECLDGPLRRRSLFEQPLEAAPANSCRALIWAQYD